MKKISLIALSLLVISFIGYCKTNAQEKPNVTGASGVENPNPDQIPENSRPRPITSNPSKPVDPNAPKDYWIEDALRDIPYVTDDGKKRSIVAQRRIQVVKPLSDEIQFNVNLLLEQISYLREAAKEINKEGINPTADLVEGLTLNMLGVGVEAGINRIASGLRQYEEKLKELPNEIEWRDEFLEKIDKSRKIMTYILCKGDCSKLDSALRDVNSSPIDILDFMERELVPYVKNYPNTVLYQNFQQSLRDYNELIADSEITSKFPEVATRGFLDKLKDVGEDYGVEIAKASINQAYFRTEGVAAGTKETLVFNGVELPFIWVPGKIVKMPKRVYYEGKDNSYTHERRKEHIIVPQHSTDVKGFWILETPVTREMYDAILSYYAENKGVELGERIKGYNEAINKEVKRKVEEGELGEQALKYQLLDKDKVLASLNGESANPLSMVISALNLRKENGVYGFEFRLPSDEEYFCIQHPYDDVNSSTVKCCEYFELCPIKSSDGEFYAWDHNPRYDEPLYVDYHDSNSDVRWDMNKRPRMFRLVLRQISDDDSFDDVSSFEKDEDGIDFGF